MQTIELKCARVHLRDDGLMHVNIRAGADMQLNDAVEVVEAIHKLGKGQKFPVLIEAGEFATVDKEARLFSAGKDANLYTLADAIAYCSFAQKLIADFYVRYNKPVVPTRVFAEKEEAIEWLKTFLGNNHAQHHSS